LVNHRLALGCTANIGTSDGTFELPGFALR